MANLAQGKLVEESYKNVGVVTNGKIIGYTGLEGFAEFAWPGFLTVDLGEQKVIKCIRLLLWDGLGTGKGVRDKRQYKYRLLTSKDHKMWSVIYDTLTEGYNGWQVFNFPEGMSLRYIRIHGLWNSANNGFHIVEVEAHDTEPDELQAETILERTIQIANLENEISDALPLQRNFQILIGQLERIIQDYTILNPKPIRELISQLSQ